ncbi:DUF393 domain-containing protein [Planctomycetota bacterium]|nr:DUF393 domain-containing protein [Planctomycetota bacterium]
MKNESAITVLYDGKCPICMREIRSIKKRDAHNRINAVDIASPDFSPGLFGLTTEQVNGRIHAFLPDGTCITGMEVFRQIYSSLGFGFLVNWTRFPVAKQTTDKLYDLFAHNRFRLTGRSFITSSSSNSCDTGHCKINKP